MSLCAGPGGTGDWAGVMSSRARLTCTGETQSADQSGKLHKLYLLQSHQMLGREERKTVSNDLCIHAFTFCRQNFSEFADKTESYNHEISESILLVSQYKIYRLVYFSITWTTISPASLNSEHHPTVSGVRGDASVCSTSVTLLAMELSWLCPAHQSPQ